MSGNVVSLNAYGSLVVEDWLWLATHHSFVDLDAFVVMPNHLHGIIVLHEGWSDMQAGEGGSRTAPTKSLGRLIGAFKTVSTKHVNEWRETPGIQLWQRSYYEHIIRNSDDLARIREYIAANPAKWAEDREYVGPLA